MTAWSEFLLQNPDQTEFFKRHFFSYDHFQTEKQHFEKKYFQLLSVRSSESLEASSPLFEKYQKTRIRFKCIHGGKTRPETRTKCIECPFQANLTLVLPNPRKKESFAPYLKFVEKSVKLEHNHHVSKEHFKCYSRANTTRIDTPNKAPITDLSEYDDQMIHEPLISQRIQTKMTNMDQNLKYNLANAVFHRFVSYVQIEDDTKFNRILNIFTQLTDAVEQNNLEEFEAEHRFNLEEPSARSVHSPSPVSQISPALFSEIVESHSIQIKSEKLIPKPKCSIAITRVNKENKNAPVTPRKSPYRLVTCGEPVGRIKRKNETVVDFNPPKKKERRNLNTVLKILSAKRTSFTQSTEVATTTTSTSGDQTIECNMYDADESFSNE